MMSVMLSAAGSLRWFRDALAPGMRASTNSWPRPATCRPAATGSASCPYLTGERSPHPDPLARGAFIGLTVTHDRRHLTRAVLEGVAFGLRDGLDLMVGAGMPVPTQVRASGGGIASALWRQILADVLEAEIATVGTSEGAAYGAGLLAAVGAGWYPSVGCRSRGHGARHAVSRSPGRTLGLCRGDTPSIGTCIPRWRRASRGCDVADLELGELLARWPPRASCPG